MIIFDDINKIINPYGGINIYFEKLFYYLEINEISYDYLKNGSITGKPRFLERIRKCDISNVSNYQDKLFHSTYYRLPNRDVKVITTLHDFISEKFFNNPKSIILKKQKKNAIFNSDFIICISNNTYNDLLNFYPTINKNKVKVIYNGVSDNFFQYENFIKRESFVLYVGSRVSYKNFDKIVISLKNIKNKTLYIVGGGNLSEKEIDLLNNYIPSRYKYFGYISEKELNKLYNQAYCLLYPSKYEGFGIPIIEAQKCGCPVIAFNSPSSKEITGKSALLLNSLATEEIIYKLKLLEDIDFRNQLIIDGLKNAKKYSWHNTFKETLKVYKSLI